MNSLKGRSAMLMTKGIMDLRSDPPRLICTILTFEHPETKKAVTLYPIPNIAASSYFNRVLNVDELSQKFDKVLCEDGRLPFQAGTAPAARQQTLKKFFPYFSLRPVASDGTKLDGLLARDAIESRMAYQMILASAEPPVDPRARRGVERIDTYPEGTRVVAPWGVYHIPYFRYRLLKEGYTQVNSEEVVIFGFQQIFSLMLVVGFISFIFTFMVFSLIFR